MIKIHNFPRGARGLRVMWQCEEMGLPYQVEQVSFPTSAAYRALQCRDAARIDFRSDAKGVPHFLEANPLAGLNPSHSDLPILAAQNGIDFTSLMGLILDAGLARYGLARSKQQPRRKRA